MSWWGIGNDDVIGDGPANVLTEALVAIGRARKEKGQMEPGLLEILDGFAEVLRKDGATALEDGSANPFQCLVARLESSTEVISCGMSGQAEQLMMTVFRRALAVIQRQYQERWERKPRLREVLETMAFILGYSPENYLSGMENQSVDEITVK